MTFYSSALFRTSAQVALISLVFPLAATHAIPEFKITDTKELSITSADGTSASLPTGTIGRQINADNQIFKVSYGKDLRGRVNVIIYPDPEKPQALELKVMGQDVKLSNDAVLTIISEDTTSLTQFQSGMVGTVTVGTEQLTGGASAKLSPQGLATVAPNTPVFPPEPAPLPRSKPEGDLASNNNNMTPSADLAVYEGPKVRAVEGDVLIAPAGQNLMDVIRNGGNLPTLQPDQRIADGTMIQTGPQGKAIISPFPGCIVAIQPNSKVVFQDIDFTKKNGGYERRAHIQLMEGGVLNTIKGIKPETLDYQIKTPLAVAAARGTVFGVFGDPAKTLTIVSDGTVEVKGTEGTFTLNVKNGGKLLITKDGGAPMEFPASPDELAAFANFLSSVKDFMAKNDILASGDFIGTGEQSPELQKAIDDIQKTFDPRLNDFYMTPIMS